MAEARLRLKWRERGLLFWLGSVLVVVPGVLFVLVSLGLMIFIYWPLDLDDMVIPEIEPRVEHIVVISHGLRDTTATWSDKLRQTLSSPKDARDNLLVDVLDDNVQIISLDWNLYAQNTFRCSVNGKRLGESLGNLLAANPMLRSLHLVAHSCGAFVNLGICEALREQRSDVTIQSTFLDPVTVYGGLFWDFGLERFGNCADFSDASIDTEDDVLGSNQLLPATHTFDVTAARKQAEFDGSPHVWPTIFYQRLAENNKILDIRTDPTLSARYPRGVLEIVSY